MAHEGVTMEVAEAMSEEVKKMRILFRIADDIKAGRLPESYSAKGAELAAKYSGEELQEYAYGGY